MATGVPMRLAWCDKIAIVWGGALFLILACAWQGPYFWWTEARYLPATSSLVGPATPLNEVFPPLWLGAWDFGWRIVGIPWLILRLIDLVIGGPTRRRGVIVVRPVVPPTWHPR
jgi:hypothetical protein